MDKKLIAELRHQFTELVDELESNGLCIRRECMFDWVVDHIKGD